MIAVTGAYPGYAGGFRFLDRGVRGAAHHQVSHGVVAIEQCGGGLLTDEADIGPGVDASALNALHVLGQTKDAVTLRSAGIGFGNERGRTARVRLRKTDGFENARDKFTELGDR